MSKLLSFAFILLACASLAHAGTQSTCKALVLEAGGDLGAYEAGVIQGLVEQYQALGKIEEVYWDVFVGVSVGALTAAGLGQFPKEETVEMAAWVVGLWRNIKKQDVYKNWLGGIVQGIVFEESLYKTDPLRAFLTSKITRPQARKLSIGAANANNGSFTRFDETLSIPDIVQALMASSAVPALFPYQNFQGNTYMDGGIIRSIDVGGAIEKCLEIVDDPSQITIDVILITHKHLKYDDIPLNMHPIKVSLIAANVRSYLKSRRNLVEGKDFYPTINWRHIIQPSKKLPNANYPFNFNAKQIEKMIQQGIAEGKASVVEQTENPIIPSGDQEMDTLSFGAKRAFIEAYESVFSETSLPAETVSEASA